MCQSHWQVLLKGRIPKLRIRPMAELRPRSGHHCQCLKACDLFVAEPRLYGNRWHDLNIFHAEACAQCFRVAQ
jgi:hypothetical protein